MGLRALDEGGLPLASATYNVEAAGALPGNDRIAPATGAVGPDGRFRLEGLAGPVVITLSAPGHLDEPLVVDESLSRAEAEIRLRREAGVGGRRRIVLHFGGDTMLGRRYLVPTSELTARVVTGDGGASAREVVSPLAPLFRAAHFRSVNLETVVGNFAQSEAYPKKRFLLQSPPETIHLLDELAVDLCTLGNNHARDWLDVGVQSTVDALDAASIAHVGGAATPEEAAVPRVLELAGYKLGFLSYTSVNGDFVNDNLPLNSAARPSPLSPSEAWQYELRSFGFNGTGISVPTALRRVGQMWLVFTQVEEAAQAAGDLEELWAAMVAVYPELQDWVARRGHGGANPYVASAIDDDVQTLRSQGCDLVVVQFHSGFQFFEVKSIHLEESAHRAIDVGADLVVCHHPHVLQGFEWYQGKLIAYSLGNFVFDQDFLSTFSSIVLRVIFEETSLLEARVLPLVIERYRPRPLGGAAAARVVQLLHERSVLPFRSERVGGGVRNLAGTGTSGVTPASLRLERGSGVIEEGAAPSDPVTVAAGENGILDLAAPSLTRSRGPGGVDLAQALLGRDLFRYGDFEDDMADGELRGGAHWLTNDTFKRIEVIEGAPSGRRVLKLTRSSTNTQRVLVRPVARIPMVAHRLFDLVGGEEVPADGTPTYSLRMKARAAGSGRAFARFDVYHFDDSNPTEDPESTLLRSVEVTLPVVPDDSWREVLYDVPAEIYRPAGTVEANVVLLNLGLEPPASGTSVLRLDDVQLLEWRDAEDLPDGFYSLDALRLPFPGVELEIEQTRE